MNKKSNFTRTLNKLLLILFISILSLNCCNRSKMETKKIETQDDMTQIIRTGSLVSVLNNMVGYDFEKRGQIITFINNALEHKGKSFYEEEAYSYYGVTYSYNSKGKYLFVTETEFGGGGSSFENEKTYIFDTELVKLIPIESIFINATAPNSSFNKLVIEYLLKDEAFNNIERDNLPRAENVINDYGFNLVYAKDGIGLRWNEGSLAANAAGAFIIVLPYSKVQNFLTQTGKEIFK